ncbi:MAG: acyl-ACP--UDP-N-acetylglucosamine O-acyltransferase [Acidobacteria bacterium]|nr:acyl-ACP--UDP-N-acetylglucosamine O-acyltransferase [Acidobacteriota bacterium]
MTVRIHPLALVEPGAELGEGVEVGPFCVVESGARIGDRCLLRSHVVVAGSAELGSDNEVYPHTTLGLAPQDLKYKGEPTRFVLGDRNVVRENCTLHRGTGEGGGISTVGSGNLLQVGAHVAHDCLVGNDNVLGHQSSLAGHVTVGNGCIVGAYSAVHQFCRVGDHAFMGGFTVATLDVLPFMRTVGTRDVKSYGVNAVGLKRRGFTDATIEALKKAHQILFQAGHPRDQGLELAERAYGQVPEVAALLAFIRESPRGVHRG